MTTSIEEQAAAPASLLSLSVVPNPARTFTMVSAPELRTPARFELYTAAGQRVRCIDVSSSSFELPLEGLGAGLYYGRLIAAGRSYCTQVQVVR